ncbi:MAG: M20/M25/M40 family metallo-hydrolase [Deltaproteobacteria bacterium]|nr:M20/M25/M40 family metallo-hydrolase [Deltaproteobacteria bacterium]
MARSSPRQATRRPRSSSRLQEAVLKALDRKRLTQTLKDLVNIPSPTGEEKAIGQYLGEQLDRLGLRVTFQEVEAERLNVIGEWKGTGGGPTLFFGAHFDTSTTGKERHLGKGHRAHAVEEDGWIYGLGVSNMKNAFAGYLMAVEMLQKAGVALKGDLIVAGVVGEIEKAPVEQYEGREYRGGGSGTLYMMHHGLTADLAIVGEPTGLRLQPGNTGYIFAKITTLGVPQHTYSKHLGVDAIEKMLPVMQAIKAWEPRYQQKYRHPFMKPLIGVGAIDGGYPFKPSICPAPFCNLYLHITTIPGTKPMAVRRDLEELLDGLRRRDPGLRAEVEFYLYRDGYEVPRESPVVRSVEAAHRQVTGRAVIFPEPERYAVSADCSIMHDYGVPAITYGAGGINPEGAYGMYYQDKGECLGIEHLVTATKVYALAALDLCSRDRAELTAR